MRAVALAVSALLSLAAAQSNNDVGLGLKAIEAHFTQSHIVPDFLNTFQPQALLNVNYGTGNIQPGQKFTKEQVGSAPTLTVLSSSPLSGSFALAMMDADVPNSKLPETNRHWLLTNVSLGQDSVVNNATATTTTRYWGPWPPQGSGPHRYVIMLYAQPSGFAPPAEFTQTEMPVAPMDWNAYVSNSHLGDLIAANYIQVEEGTATTSIFSTAPVVTSTLAVASTTSGSAPASSSTNGSNGATVLGLHIPVIMGLTALTALFLA